MPLIDHLIPKEFRNNPKDYRSSKLILIIDLVLICCATVFMFSFWWIGFKQGAYIAAYAIVNAIIFPFLMYYTRNFLLCGNFFSFNSWVVFTSAIIFSGGVDSPFFMWLLSIPPIALFYMRGRVAQVWLWLTVGTAVTIALTQFFGIFYFHQHIDAAYRPLILLFNYSALLILFVAVFNTFKSGFKRINKRMAVTNEKLTKSNGDLERFAYIASHDLKSPLRNVLSFLELFLNRHGDSIEAEPKEYLNIARDKAEHMLGLIDDILEYSRSSNVALKQEHVDLNNTLKLICDQLQNDPLYSHANVTVWSLPAFVGDATRFHQLFLNMVENGLKYNKHKVPMVEVRYFSEKEEHYFVVEDNGIGIPEKFHKKIFQMFERLHTPATYKGTGIGLAICMKHVQAYGGHVEIESEEGKGTRFHIRFPKKNLPESRINIAQSEEVLSV